jgi:hypothetical protein
MTEQNFKEETMIYGETKGVSAYGVRRVEDAFTKELTNFILRLLEIGHREQHIVGPLLEKHLARELDWSDQGLLGQYKKYVEDRLLEDLQKVDPGMETQGYFKLLVSKRYLKEGGGHVLLLSIMKQLGHLLNKCSGGLVHAGKDH